jgi:hypothetical protein
VIFVIGPRPEAIIDTALTLLDTLMGTVPSDSLAADSLGTVPTMTDSLGFN